MAATVAGGPQTAAGAIVDANKLEAWKGLIDFTKTVLSLSTAVLAVYVSYVVVNGESLDLAGLASPVLLLLSIAFSLWAFGGALGTLKSGNSNKSSIFLANLGCIALILAICVIPFTRPDNPASIDQVLFRIESSTKKYSVGLAPQNCRSIERKGDYWVLTYAEGGTVAEVTYSIPLRRVESVK